MYIKILFSRQSSLVSERTNKIQRALVRKSIPANAQMNSTNSIANKAKEDQPIGLHKTLSFGAKEQKGKLNENSLAAKQKKVHQSSAASLSHTVGQQSVGEREFGRTIDTNTASAPASAVRMGKQSTLANQAPDSKIATNKVSAFSSHAGVLRIHTRTNLMQQSSHLFHKLCAIRVLNLMNKFFVGGSQLTR